MQKANERKKKSTKGTSAPHAAHEARHQHGEPGHLDGGHESYEGGYKCTWHSSVHFRLITNIPYHGGRRVFLEDLDLLELPAVLVSPLQVLLAARRGQTARAHHDKKLSRSCRNRAIQIASPVPFCFNLERPWRHGPNRPGALVFRPRGKWWRGPFGRGALASRRIHSTRRKTRKG